MAAPKTRTEQIAERLVEALQAISESNGYAFTIERVLRVEEPTLAALEGAGVDHVALVSQGDTRAKEFTNREIEKDTEFFVLSARRHRAQNRSPWRAGYASDQSILNAMAGDVERALRADYTLGTGLNGQQLADNTEITDLDTRITAGESWIACEWRLTVRYRHLKTEA